MALISGRRKYAENGRIVFSFGISNKNNDVTNEYCSRRTISLITLENGVQKQKILERNTDTKTPAYCILKTAFIKLYDKLSWVVLLYILELTNCMLPFILLNVNPPIKTVPLY